MYLQWNSSNRYTTVKHRYLSCHQQGILFYTKCQVGQGRRTNWNVIEASIIRVFRLRNIAIVVSSWRCPIQPLVMRGKGLTPIL